MLMRAPLPPQAPTRAVVHRRRRCSRLRATPEAAKRRPRLPAAGPGDSRHVARADGRSCRRLEHHAAPAWRARRTDRRHEDLYRCCGDHERLVAHTENLLIGRLGPDECGIRTVGTYGREEPRTSCPGLRIGTTWSHVCGPASPLPSDPRCSHWRRTTSRCRAPARTSGVCCGRERWTTPPSRRPRTGWRSRTSSHGSSADPVQPAPSARCARLSPRGGVALRQLVELAWATSRRSSPSR
jgi:hypothetical protein